MNYELRKSDSLAHATGSFKQNLDDINHRWVEHIVKLGDLGPQIIGGIKKSLQVKDNNEIKSNVKNNLTEFSTILSDMEKVNADMVDLMIEMEGLDFPLKTPNKILKLCEMEEDNSKLLQNIVKNLSKTYNFLQNEDSETELLLNSLNSFESTYSELEKIIEQGLSLTDYLSTELDTEHKKAMKYLGKV